jgi:hypothetical protein
MRQPAARYASGTVSALKQAGRDGLPQALQDLGLIADGRPAAHRHAWPDHPAETRREILTKKLHLSAMYFMDLSSSFSLLASMK